MELRVQRNDAETDENPTGGYARYDEGFDDDDEYDDEDAV